MLFILVSYCFFFNDTTTTEIYTLSLHDALPIYWQFGGKCWRPWMLKSSFLRGANLDVLAECPIPGHRFLGDLDRKSTRLNSSHITISYAVFCLKKKKNERVGKQISTEHNEITIK